MVSSSSTASSSEPSIANYTITAAVKDDDQQRQSQDDRKAAALFSHPKVNHDEDEDNDNHDDDDNDRKKGEGKRRKKKTPLPLKSIFVLSIVMISEPMIMTILFPFVYYMVKSFNLSDDEKDIGAYAGLISSSFAFCQCLTSLLWGSLSDRIGRKPVLLIGLLGNFVSMLLFGFSKNLAWAVTTRSISGLLSGNIGVAKCVLGEITDETNQNIAFAWYGLVFSIGQILGPMIGGLLADPARQYPKTFGNIALFIEYPYLLPCLISALLTALGFIIGIFWLEESLGKGAYITIDEESSSFREEEGRRGSIPSQRESDPSLLSHRRGSVLSTSHRRASVLSHALSVHGYPEMRGSMASLPRNLSMDNNSEHRPLLPSSSNNSDNSNSRFSFFDIPNASKHTIAAYAVLALSSTLYDELLPLWTATKLPAGLGFSSQDIGVAMTATGIIDLFSNLLIYPWLQDTLGLVLVFRWSQAVYVVIHALFPLVSMVAVAQDGDIHDPWVWITLIVFMGIRVSAAVFGFTSIIIMVQNSCSPDRLGTVNGYGQMLASFLRGVGPALGGALWTWSLKNNLDFFPLNHFFVFVLISLLSLASYLHSHRFPVREFRNSSNL